MLHNIFNLPDNRQLGYAFYGPDNGQPVLYFHGTPSSRLEPLVSYACGLDLDTLLTQNNIRLIAVDRPGIGLSSFDINRTYISFARDVFQLLQHLHIDACKVMCWSGGGPYALAMAHQYPGIIKSVSVIAGFSSSFAEKEVYDTLGWSRIYFNIAKKMPLLLQGSLAAVKYIKVKTPITQKLYDLPDEDYYFLKHPAILNLFLDVTVKEACKKSAAGPVQEAALYFKPFHFNLRAIKTPVHFWWGTNDNAVTYIHAKKMEEQLTNVSPHYKPNEGHISIFIKYLEEVLQTTAAL